MAHFDKEMTTFEPKLISYMIQFGLMHSGSVFHLKECDFVDLSIHLLKVNQEVMIHERNNSMTKTLTEVNHARIS